MDPYFNLFIRLSSAFFLFSVKMQKQKNKQTNKKTGSNCAIIGCNLSKKHKLALHKTQSGQPN